MSGRLHWVSWRKVNSHSKAGAYKGESHALRVVATEIYIYNDMHMQPALLY